MYSITQRTKDHANPPSLKLSDLSDGQTATNTDADLILSDCVQHSTVTLYCKEHGQIMCSRCKVLKHKICRTITIEEISESYSKTELNAVSESLARLKNELDLFKHERNTDLLTIEVMKEKCIYSFRHFREEFNSYLDDVHEHSIKRIDTYALKEKQKVGHNIEPCLSTMKSFKIDVYLLDEARNTFKKANMFSTELKMTIRLTEYQHLLQDLLKGSKSPLFSFKIHERLLTAIVLI